MPYIPQEQRTAIDPAINELVQAIKKVTVLTGTATIQVPPDGALNYSITRLIQALLLPGGQPSYLLLERVSGLLGCIDKEIYRRTAAPYENIKAKQNGDVFDYIEDGQLVIYAPKKIGMSSPPVNHKGTPCIHDKSRLCQEGFCDECYIHTGARNG